MSGLTYETVAKFAQQAGTIYFALMFLIVLAWVLWPKNRQGFDEAAQIPFRETPTGSDLKLTPDEEG